MLYLVNIKVTSYFLGDRPDQGVLRFNRSDASDNQWAIPPNEWRWALGEAIRSLHLEDVTSCDFIFPPAGIEMPTVHLYARQRGKARPYIPAQGGTPQQHEAFRPGSSMVFPIQVVSSLPPISGGTMGDDSDQGSEKLQPPTQDQLEKIMRHIGAYLGLSPWGKNHLKGRFEIVSVVEANA